MFRFVLSALLTLLFVASLVTYLILGSLISYVDDSDHLLDTAADFGLRDELVTLATRVLIDEVRADPQLVSISETELRLIVSSVLTRGWVEETIRASHKGMKSSLRGFEDDAVFDFRQTKAALLAAASQLEERALANCEEALGADACGDEQQARRRAQKYQARVTGAIHALPDRIDLTGRLSARDQRKAKRLTKGLRTVETIKMVSLAMTLGLLIAIGLLNSGRLCSFLMSVGAALSLGGGSYFLAVSATRGEGRAALEEALADKGTGPIASFTGRFSAHVLDDALGTSLALASSLALCGLLMFGAGLLLWRRASEA